MNTLFARILLSKDKLPLLGWIISSEDVLSCFNDLYVRSIVEHDMVIVASQHTTNFLSTNLAGALLDRNGCVLAFPNNLFQDNFNPFLSVCILTIYCLVVKNLPRSIQMKKKVICNVGISYCLEGTDDYVSYKQIELILKYSRKPVLSNKFKISVSAVDTSTTCIQQTERVIEGSIVLTPNELGNEEGLIMKIDKSHPSLKNELLKAFQAALSELYVV